MHKKYAFLLAAAVSTTTASLLDYTPTINFCTEANGAGKCYQEAITFDKCTEIPDSNATGDNGSQITMDVHENGDYCCAVYFDNHCEQSVKELDLPLAINWSWTINNAKSPYRAFVCWETKGVKAKDNFKCEDGDTPPKITY